MDGIVLNGLMKAYEGKTVLNVFSAVLPCGQVTAVMAPSGAGKTTLLRLLMGLDVPDSGRIEGLAGHRMAAVFQEDRLCGYLSPVDNIRLVNPARTAQEVRAALAEMGLAGCEAQPCRELSGGMNRRVALLRALLADADLLLLDEPFKGLDARTRQDVMRRTRALCAGRTVVLVTHDPAEAEALGAAQVLALD